LYKAIKINDLKNLSRCSAAELGSTTFATLLAAVVAGGVLLFLFFGSYTSSTTSAAVEPQWQSQLGMQ
jgi:hypothetical protein